MSLGKYLKTKRKEKNLSMNKLGELTGITAMYISQLESGKRVKPSIEVLEKLSESLEVPYEDLMKAAGYITVDIKGFSDISQKYFENGVLRKSDEKDEEEQFELDSLLASDNHIFYQDRLLTAEEKTKIKSLIEIVLKD
ncbi:helix-turn-helix domain-containing protein [Brevibacillus laterosporus]|uniref:helix-turn-helix domain-containing protein n=1 Tax=Brevibacillus laterosporus TaxID=1465 RepID=UPI00215C6998|nr:helix-turn-helix transcriptional regulator [Brevibacillus laterosporus]MCR8995955.1 helix-turn-helix domain-containing protein [Brevibacillus laterosporus]